MLRILMAVACLVILSWPAAVGAQVETPALHILKVTAPDKAAYIRLFDMGLDLPEHLPGPEVLVVGTDAEKAWLEAQGYTVAYELRQATRYFAQRAAAAGAATMGGFRTLSECWSAIDSVIAAYPAIVSPKLNIGTTLGGNPIYAVRISDNPQTDEGEPAVLITGLHHAREPIGTHIAIYTMQQLAQNYGVDPDITTLVNEREIWFIPIINPDGYLYNEAIAPAGGGMWRKNRKDNGDGSFGVDPNRNYGYEWGYDDAGSSPDPFSDTFRGSGPFSELETQAVRDFCLIRPNIRIAFNYHSYSNLLLYPWGYFRGFTPDQLLFAAIADSATTFNGYLPIPGWVLYPTNGDSDDWMYAEQGILAFTPEVGSQDDYFWPDPARIEPLTLENYPANVFIIEIADAPERLLPPLPSVWDSIVVAGTDSLELFWHNDDTSVNAPVSYQVTELFGAQRVMDDFESGPARWQLAGFTHTDFDQFLGDYSLYSETGDRLTSLATTVEPIRVEAGDTLRFWTKYNLEEDWDYAYVEISADGGQTFTSIRGNLTTMTNPHGNNLGHGITGVSADWVVGWFGLSDYVGEEIIIRFAYHTDASVHGFGIYVDNVSPVQVFDSTLTVATVAASPAVLGDHPEGDYYFRVRGQDAQGQTTTGTTRNFSYTAGPGYTVGDLDSSGTIVASDIVYMVNYIFKAGPDPRPVWQVADVNASGTVSPADIVYLVNYVFKGGPPPLQP
jgi:hypothetical protein